MSRILKIFSQNKKSLLSIIGLGLILSSLPLQLVTAEGETEKLPWFGCPSWNVFCILDYIGQYILSLPVRIGFFVLLLPLVLLALFSGLLFTIVVAVCNWMTYIALNVGVIPGNDLTPEIVSLGWTFTRDFINMFFILILVFIGLATILKLREYEAKKTLPKLIVIALLINFTPVMVGFIVDMGNLVTNFFLQKSGQILSFPNILNMVWNYLSESLKTVFGVDGRFLERFAEMLGLFIGLIVYGVVVIIFFLLGSWIYFWVMLTFFMRIVMLWVLMILAPIAFFSQVLPPGKTVKMLFPSILHWDRWWEELLQWVIVGVPLGFFLYLSNWLMRNTSVVESKFNVALLKTQLENVASGVGGLTLGEIISAQFISLVTSILAPTVALVLLWKGYKIAKETAPAAARAIIEGVKKLGQVATALGITAITAGAGAGAAAGVLMRVGAAATRLEERAGRRLGKGGKLLVAPLTRPIKGIEMAAAPPLLRYAAKVRKIDIEKEMKDLGIEDDIAAQVDYVNTALTNERKIQVLSWMARKGTLQKAPQAWELAANLTRKFAGDPHFRKEAADIANAIPNKIDEETKIKFEATKEGQEEMKNKIRETAEKLSMEVEIRPVIDEEAERLLKERVVKTMDEAQDLAARNVAARYLQFTELKPEDMKRVATPSIESIIAARALRDMTPKHIQIIKDNFKPETTNKVIEQAFNKMFEGKTDEESREILRNYYSSDPKHAEMVNWSLTTPAGRRLNLKWKNYLTDPNDQPTTSFAAFEKRMRIEEIMREEPMLSQLNKLQLERIRYSKRIEELRKRGQPTTYWENRLAAVEERFRSLQQEVEQIERLKEKQKEIERLRKSTRERRETERERVERETEERIRKRPPAGVG